MIGRAPSRFPNREPFLSHDREGVDVTRGWATVTLDQKIEDASALIRRVFAENSERASVTCSFQTECMALVDLVIQQQPDIPVLFLDTGYQDRKSVV